MDHVRKVLVVEDEATLRHSMVRGLAKLEGVQIAAAACTREAKEELRRAAPDLLISDLDLPDGSGLEVVAEAERLGLRVPVVFISAFLGRFRSRLPQRPDVQVYEKPVSLERLRALVEERLGPRVEGIPTSPFGVPDYVQLASLGRYSVVIEVHGAGAAGQILVHRGELWHARDAGGDGVAAFRRLAFLQPARVTCRTLGKHELPTRTMDGSAESVLLDAARAFDEAPRDAPAQVPPKAPPGVWQDAHADTASAPSTAPVAHTPSAEPETLRPNAAHRADALVSAMLDERFDTAFERGVDALLAKDFSAAYAAFAEAEMLRPDDRRVAANLTRLRAMGVLS